MHAPTACRQTGSGSVSLPCSGFFSPFPHGTGSLSVSREYLALRDGPRCFTQNSSCSALLRIPLGFGSQSCKGLSPATVSLSRLFHLTACLPHRGPTTPLLPKQQRFGLFRVRSPLLAESHFVFSSYGYLDVSVPRVRLLFEDDRPSACRVAPFGYPRIKGYLHLPTAFRSLSRPSSPPRAKASTVCPCLLSSSFTTSTDRVGFDISSACSSVSILFGCPTCQRSFCLPPGLLRIPT